MFSKTWDFVHKLYNGRRENFLIIEQFNGSYEVTRAFRNLKKKEITIVKRFSIKNLGSLKRPIKKADKIVFSLNSHNATTAESVVSLKRHHAEELINESEMDQLVYRGFWDFLNRYRAMAAKKMEISDSDLVMAYVQVREVYIGSQKLFNPIGFKGSELSLKLRGTFISRDLLASLDRFKEWGNIFVFEGASVLGPVLPETGSLIVQVKEDMTTVFKVTEEEQVFEAMSDWGTNILGKSVAADLGIDEASANAIVDRYFRDEVSAHMKRWLDLRINKGFEGLFDFLEPVRKRSGMARPKLYFSFRLPSMVSSIKLDKLRGFPIRVDEELEREEFTLKNRALVSSFNPLINQNTLALLSFGYDLPKFEPLNQLLRRRVRWLIPNF